MTFKTIKNVLQNLNFVLSELQGLCLGLILLKKQKQKQKQKEKKKNKMKNEKKEKGCAVAKCSV